MRSRAWSRVSGGQARRTGCSVGGEHLGHDPVAVAFDDLGEVAVGVVAHGDPVADVEAVRLAEVVDRPAELAGDAFGAEVVVEGEVERDRVAAVLGERELLVLLGADLDVVGLEPHDLAVDVEVEVALLVERALHLGAVDVGEQCLHAVDQLAEAWAERAEVRDDAVREQTFERRRRPRSASRSARRRSRARRRRGASRRAAEQRDRAGQRLAHAELGVGARGAAERHERARERHLGFERVVDRARRRSRASR